MKNSRGGQKGFTLIELMFSITLMGLILISSYYVLTQAHHLSIDSRTRLLALNSARSALETIKSTPIASVPAIATAQFIPAELPSGAMTITTNPANVAAVEIATVTVTVSWRGAKNRLLNLQVSTMRSRY